MTTADVRKKYLEFFEKRGHAVIPSSSLVPENDPTTLFTGSGMQPLLPYLLGEKHPQGNRLVDSQKCFRAEDIEEVGDNRHTTFFEMLGNWSLGDYFKKEQLSWIFEFLTEEINLDPSKLYVTVFAGDKQYSLPRDDESVVIWKQLFKEKNIEASDAVIGSEEDGYKRGMREGERIFYYDGKKNWWNRGKPSPQTTPIGDPCGPDSEMFYDFETEHDPSFGEYCHPNCDCGRFLEIGNSVFMEYVRTEKGFEQLPKKNVDFGGALERVTAAANDDSDMFRVDALYSVVQEIEKLSGRSYDISCEKSFRVVTDHLRGAVFMMADGVLPSNTEQGYFVRRLLRRSVRHMDLIGMKENSLSQLVSVITKGYRDSYPLLSDKQLDIEHEVAKEEARFRKTLQKGLREFEKIAERSVSGYVSGHSASTLFTTFGFPYELTEELASERNLQINRKEYEDEMKKHQETSRVGAGQKFKGGLADNSEKVTQYHTATHLMLAGLRKELGDGVHQAGSNITGERTRFDFTHPEKVEREILDRVEQYVNDAINADAKVTMETVPNEQAESDPAIEGSFWEKYPDKVNVYTVTGPDGTVYSKELCGGPHVEQTGTMGKFVIKKEEAVSAGVRRIKAVLE